MNDAQREILKRTKLFVLDMDGTIYLGDNVFDHALRFVHTVREHGIRVAYFTNNASRSPEIYYDRLRRMGFDPHDGDIVTSGDITIDYLKKHHPGESVYLVGTKALEESFIKAGIELSEKAGIVVSSFDTSLTYEKLVIACDLIRGGAVFYSTHPDFNCPTADGFIPDSGAICALITASTGKTPKYFGKPYRETAEGISTRFGVPLSETAIVGDRIYTDIALGRNNGLTSILVLTGETSIGEVNETNAPTIIVDKIGDLLGELGF